MCVCVCVCVCPIQRLGIDPLRARRLLYCFFPFCMQPDANTRTHTRTRAHTHATHAHTRTRAHAPVSVGKDGKISEKHAATSGFERCYGRLRCKRHGVRASSIACKAQRWLAPAHAKCRTAREVKSRNKTQKAETKPKKQKQNPKSRNGLAARKKKREGWGGRSGLRRKEHSTLQSHLHS